MKLAHVTQSAKKANIIISSCKYKQALLCNWQQQASIVKHRLHVWVCAVSPLLPTLLRLTRGRAATASLLRRSPPSVTLSTATCPPDHTRPAPAPSITTTQWRPATESHCQLYTAGAGTVSFCCGDQAYELSCNILQYACHFKLQFHS